MDGLASTPVMPSMTIGTLISSRSNHRSRNPAALPVSSSSSATRSSPGRSAARRSAARSASPASAAPCTPPPPSPGSGFISIGSRNAASRRIVRPYAGYAAASAAENCAICRTHSPSSEPSIRCRSPGNSATTDGLRGMNSRPWAARSRSATISGRNSEVTSDAVEQR